MNRNSTHVPAVVPRARPVALLVHELVAAAAEGHDRLGTPPVRVGTPVLVTALTYKDEESYDNRVCEIGIGTSTHDTGTLVLISL